MATSGNRSQDSESTIRDRAHHLAGQVVDKVQETASRVVGTGRDSGGSGTGQGNQQSAPIMDQAAEQVSNQVTSRLDMGKDYLVETVTGIAQALRQTGQHLREEGSQPTLAQYVDRGAERIERLGGHMRQRDASELIAEVEWFARRQPMVFAGGAFALGMLAVRFLRSSGQPQRQTWPASSTMASGGSYSGTSPMTPPSTTPHGYAGPGASTPSSVPTSVPSSTPTARPAPSAGQGAGSGLGTGTGTGTPTTPPATPATPSEQPTPRPAAAPSVGGTTTGPGTATPRPDAGSQSGSQSGGSSPSSGSTGSGGRNQP